MLQSQVLNGEFVDDIKPLVEKISQIAGVRRVSACDSFRQKTVHEQVVIEILPLSTGFYLVITGREYSQKVLVSIQRESDWRFVRQELSALSTPTPATS